MTTLDIPVTADTILFGSSGAAGSLEDFLDTRRLSGWITSGAAHLTRDVQGALRNEICIATDDLLNLDLVDVLVTGWRKHAALAAAARRTAAAPGTSEVVDLATHHITMAQRPYIDLLCDGVRVGRVQLELRLDFTVAGLVAVVRAGRLVAVQAGHCTIAATLLIEGEQVATRSARLDLPLAVRLGAGIPLLPDHDPAAPRQGGSWRGQGDQAAA
jgi:hypothetical protein